MTSKVAKNSTATKKGRATKKGTATKSDPAARNEFKVTSMPSLLPGEETQIQDIEEKKEATNEELNSRYVTGEIRIVTESARYSLAGILAMLQETVGTEKRKRYDLDPEYQRRHRWSKARKSKLVESFLMNIPVPPVFLYERDYAQFEVMDGRQRLTALAEFYGNEFALEKLEYWKELEGRKYENLPEKVRDGIDRRYISSIILLKETARDEEQAATLKKIVFERLNSGGVALSHQETRNAVYKGKLNTLCLNLSKKDAAFRKMWQIPDEPRSDVGDSDVVLSQGERMFQKMEDVELVLRFFAYRHLSHRDMGLNSISTFLDRFLVEGNKFPDSVINEYSEIFEATTSLLWEVFGERAFCQIESEAEAQGRPTKVVYDPLMWVASRYARGSSRAAILKNPDVLRERLLKMHKEHGEKFAGRRTNSNHVRERNQCTEEVFADVVAKLNG